MKSLPGVPWRVGLTGGIGSGKSTVARMWQAMGADLIDADALSRQVTEPGGSAIAPLLAQFGPDCLLANGALNRDWMRARVFANPEQRQLLERIVHPLVAQAIAQASQNSRAAWQVWDIPLLVESARWRAQLDRVVVVDCDTDTQVARVAQRSGWSAEQTQRVMATQASRAQRLASADVVIFNQGITLETLQHICREIGVRFGLSSAGSHHTSQRTHGDPVRVPL